MSRTPSEIKATRMGPLARLPAFFALESKRAVVAGGSQAAIWKAELLSAAGAQVDVFAAVADEDLQSLAAAPPRGAISIHDRRWAAVQRGESNNNSLKRTTSIAPQIAPASCHHPRTWSTQ